MSRKEVQAIIDEVDENGDGKLDYKEVRKERKCSTSRLKLSRSKHAVVGIA